jgi:hypothetical protein
VHTNEEIEWFVNMYISYDVSLLPNPLQNAQNINTHVNVKKNNVVCRFHHPLHPMHETKKFKPLQIDGNNPFHNNTSIHQQKKFNL